MSNSVPRLYASASRSRNDAAGFCAAGAVALDLDGAIRLAQIGDEAAFRQLVNTYRSAAERVARHILRTEEAAADAVQDALIKVHRAMPTFEEGNFRAWLLRIVTNTCYDYLRKQRRRPTVSLDALLENSTADFFPEQEENDPEQILLRKEQREALLAAIDRLSPWHREVVLLVDVYGYDYSEAAALLGLPLGTVKSRLSRARATLRDRLAKAALFNLQS